LKVLFQILFFYPISCINELSLLKIFDLIETDFIPKELQSSRALKGSFTWTAPSNIALVKYWGKKEPQIPQNASISFTLNNCFTKTTLEYSKLDGKNSGFKFEVIFDGARKEDFKPKIEEFFNRIELYTPYLKDYHWVIRSENSFPHSSGIASSASSMAALALCLMSLEQKLDPTITEEHFKRKASFLARLGSGSASRSVEGELIVWGAHREIEGSSDLLGIKFPYSIDENFKNFQDTILLVDRGEKQVSSSIGHGLMFNHPYAKQRFKQANNHLELISRALQTGDMDAFIEIVESEAMSLHAMMLTSNPSFMLMKPNTVEIIQKIREYRSRTGTPVCFTLDAGANVHVLYPKSEIERILPFIKEELLPFCQERQCIFDQSGNGPSLIHD
jgi:diphosphomevalonate decarboxylase